MADESKPEKSEDTIMRSVADVYRHLQDQGIKVARGKVYEDVKKGLIPRDTKTATFPLEGVETYIRVHLAGATQGRRSDETMELLQKRKLAAETEKAAAQAAHWQLRAEIETGKWIERAQYEQDLAGRAAVFKSDLTNFFQSYAAEMVQVCGGDHRRVQSLADFCQGHLDGFLHRYSQPTEWAVPGTNDDSEL